MSLFVSWDAVAEYVTQSKGYNYLINPTSWMDAFKETVSDARWIGTEGETGGGFIFKQPVDWINVGENIAPSIEGGVKSLPSVETVVTDVTTGGVVAGETALATEAVGTTITLTTAGWIATALTGLGLGVVGYELAPHFWTDISNAIFEPITGEHLDYDKTEPFLRKKIKTLLSTDDNGKIITYADKSMLERAYNFIKTHIRSDGYDIYDDYTWQLPSEFGTVIEEHTPNNSISQTFDVEIGKISLTDDAIQSVLHQTQLVLNKMGIPEIEPSASGIVNKLRNLYPNINNANVYRIRYLYDYISPTVQYRHLLIDGTRASVDTDNVVKATTFRKSYNRLYRRLRPDRSIATSNASDYGYEVLLKDKNGNDIAPQNHCVFSFDYDLDTQTGTVKDNGDSDIVTNICNLNYWLNYSNTGASCDITLISPIFDGDTYLQDNGVVSKGKTPTKNDSFDDRYSEWNRKKKTTGQPTKNGADKTIIFLPSNIPMSDDDANKIIKYGVNVSNNSYNDNQDDNQNGKDTPFKNSIDDFNKSTENNIDDYNKSVISPEITPEPSPTPLPPYPTDPPSKPKGDSGDTPSAPIIGGVTASGMVSVYNPTKQQLIDFSGWLWSPNFLDNFIKIFANPMDAIIGLHIMYTTPISSGNEHIITGYLDSGVNSKIVTQQYSKLNCGEINVPEYYGNAIDYEPYTTLHIYLPFIGIMPLRANDVIGKRIKLEYGIDALTGTCLATITSIKDGSEIACYTFAGNCAVQIPVSGGNYAEMIKALSGFMVAGAGAIATGNPILALGAGASFMSGNTSVQHSGAIGSNAGACGVRIPYLIITRKKAYDAQNYQHYYGFPSNNHVKLNYYYTLFQ